MRKSFDSMGKYLMGNFGRMLLAAFILLFLVALAKDVLSQDKGQMPMAPVCFEMIGIGDSHPKDKQDSEDTKKKLTLMTILHMGAIKVVNCDKNFEENVKALEEFVTKHAGEASIEGAVSSDIKSTPHGSVVVMEFNYKRENNDVAVVGMAFGNMPK